MDKITTIRTENKYHDYFYKKWYNYFYTRNVYGYLGHTHTPYMGLNFEVLGSCGYDLYYKDIAYKNKVVRIIADLHLGVPEVDKKYLTKILPILKQDGISKIIFLGDTFDLALTKNSEIIKHKFWNWYNITDKKCVFVIGNHDINIIKKDNNKIAELLRKNKKTIITREYFYRSMCFCHGDQFDPLTMFLGKFYLRLFQIYDYTGKFGYFLWEKIIKKPLKIIDDFFNGSD